MEPRVRMHSAGLWLATLVVLAVPVLFYLSAQVGGAEDPLLRIPARVAAMAALLCAAVLAPGLLWSWLRWWRGQSAVLLPVACGLGLVVVVMIMRATLWRGQATALDASEADAIEVRLRALSDLRLTPWYEAFVSVASRPEGVAAETHTMSHGWDGVPAQDEDAAPAALCLSQVTVRHGPLQMKRYLDAAPGTATHGAGSADGLDRCGQGRLSYVKAAGRLESMLMTPGVSAEDLRRVFHDNLAQDGMLPLLGTELAEPWRSALADLRFSYGKPVNERVQLFDVALLVQDTELIAASFPQDGVVPHQRYALAKLGLYDAVVDMVPVALREARPGRADSYPMRFNEVIREPGRYQPVDFIFANTACDADYATWLIGLGEQPALLEAQDLLLRLVPAAESPLEGQSLLGPFPLDRRHTLDCEALAAIYGDEPEVFRGGGASNLGRQLATRLGRMSRQDHQAAAGQGSAGQTLVALRAYAALYRKRPEFGAMCGTLQYAPWALHDPELIKVYRRLWLGWKEVMTESARSELVRWCNWTMPDPIHTDEARTTLRNDLLELAGLPCRVGQRERAGKSPQTVIQCDP